MTIFLIAHTLFHLKFLLLGGAVPAFDSYNSLDSSATAPRAPEASKTVLAFVSDTQDPLWIETIRLQSDRNEEATAAIFNALVQERDVAALFHLGDVTTIGSSEAEWQKMDTYCKVFLSGHAHAFEHFQGHGIDFLVIGGGGGCSIRS